MTDPRPVKLLMRRPHLNGIADFPALSQGTVLRRADFPDAFALAQVLASAFADARWTPSLAHRLLLDAPDVSAVFIVVVDGVARATASARYMPGRFPDAGYLHWVGTHAEAAGRGLGRLANLAVLHEFIRVGRTSAVLETDDFRLAAIRMYQTLGFQREDVDPSHPARWQDIETKLAQGSP